MWTNIMVVSLLFVLTASCAGKKVVQNVEADDKRRPHLFINNMRECMAMYHDESICENKIMRSCQEDMDRQDCGKILLQVKDHDQLINKINEARF
jgi:hypothetical protein